MKEKRIFKITTAKTKWAKKMLTEHGEFVQLAADLPIAFRFVSVEEEDTWNFKHWSYWVDKTEIDCTEIK